MGNYIGEKLGNYRLAQLLGSGGFAEVYLGEHIYLKTQAAIKVLRVSLADEALAQFLTEARTIAHLEHPHIVRILEFGIQGSTPYLVMSYAPNGTIRRRYPQGSTVPLHTIIEYIRQIANALQYAHTHKLIHRDVKPENILLGRDGEILLSDFGLAIMSSSSRPRKHVDRAGTTAYMAPEQIEGKPSKASDQYALGVVVYEWLCGCLPFTGLDQEIAIQHLQVPPPPLRERVPSIPPAIEQVVMKALAKDPSQRFLSVLHFAQVLEEAYQPHKLVRSLQPDSNIHTDDSSDSRHTPLEHDTYKITEPEPFPRPESPSSPSTTDEDKMTSSAQNTPNSSQPFSSSSGESSPANWASFSANSEPFLVNHESSPSNQEALPVIQKLIEPSAENLPLASLQSVHLSSIESVPALLTPQSKPISLTPTSQSAPEPSAQTPRRISRRVILASLASLTAVGAGAFWYFRDLRFPATSSHGPISIAQVSSAHQATPGITQVPGTMQASTPGSGTPPTAPGGPRTNSTQNVGSSPDTTSASTPMSTPGATPTANTTSTSQSTKTANTAPTSTPTPTPRPQPTPTAASTSGSSGLTTVQVTGLPSQVQNNSNQVVNVVTNKGNTTVVLNVNYTSSNGSYTSASQTTDSAGRAAISWRVHSSKVPVGNIMAMLVVTATDSNGHQIQSPSYQVAVTK